MEEAAELGNYRPFSFTSPKEQEYIEFLWDAFESNYTHGKYQFAFLACHMLTMGFVYFEIWQIKQTKSREFEMAMNGFGSEWSEGLRTNGCVSGSPGAIMKFQTRGGLFI